MSLWTRKRGGIASNRQVVGGLHVSQGFSLFIFSVSPSDHLVGLVVKASASIAGDPGFESRLRLDFSGSSHTSDLKKKKKGTPVTALPGTWRFRVNTGTGWPGVSIL